MEHSHPHSGNYETMKAVEFDGKPFSMKVKTLPIPKITQPTDAVIRVTSAGICGTDLHTFHGRFPVKPPLTMGHEIVGVVHTIGSKVHDIKIGDRVIVSVIVFEDGLEGVDPVTGTFGVGTLPGLQQFNGGQASFVRVPFASENLLLLPAGKQHELDYVLLADIFPTAHWALDCSGFVFGDVVVVFGAGPVGLLCAYSAFLRGASKVYSVDRVPQRLAKAKSIGAIPIDFSKGDPVAQIMKHEPEGVDRACDCIGYECVNAKGVNEGNLVLTQAINVVRTGGGIGVIGVYIPEDAGGATPALKKGIFEIPFGESWIKGQSIKSGIVQLRQFQPALKRLIESGRAKPSFIFDRELRIEDAPEAYKEFSDHDFIKSVIRLDGEKGSLIDNDKVEEKSSAQKNIQKNGALA
ncbi:putative S-glutathione dehydrogenase [Hyaloscypha finlandica]|nr:putative S-glutathione dehydrogenase [Hyaloscypha finlandica]